MRFVISGRRLTKGVKHKRLPNDNNTIPETALTVGKSKKKSYNHILLFFYYYYDRITNSFAYNLRRRM